MDKNNQVSELPTSTKVNQSEWKTIGVKVRHTELMLLNKQLDRLNYTTLGELVKDLMSGKISRLTDDQQIEIMKTNLQTNAYSLNQALMQICLSSRLLKDLGYFKQSRDLAIFILKVQ
jgi:hypothetical protein